MSGRGTFKERFPDLLKEWRALADRHAERIFDRVYDRLVDMRGDWDDEDYEPSEAAMSDGLEEAWDDIMFEFQSKHGLTDKQMEKIDDAS